MKAFLIGTTYFGGTQADANKKAKEEGTVAKKVEIPTDKEGLLTFINELSQRAQPVQSTVTVHQGDLSTQLAPRPTAAGLQKLADGADADTIVEHINAVDHAGLARITEASIFRMRELLKQAQEGPSVGDRLAATNDQVVKLLEKAPSVDDLMDADPMDDGDFDPMS